MGFLYSFLSGRKPRRVTSVPTPNDGTLPSYGNHLKPQHLPQNPNTHPKTPTPTPKPQHPPHKPSGACRTPALRSTPRSPPVPSPSPQPPGAPPAAPTHGSRRRCRSIQQGRGSARGGRRAPRAGRCSAARSRPRAAPRHRLEESTGQSCHPAHVVPSTPAPRGPAGGGTHPLVLLAVSLPSSQASPVQPAGQAQCPVAGSHVPPFWHRQRSRQCVP